MLMLLSLACYSRAGIKGAVTLPTHTSAHSLTSGFDFHHDVSY